MYFGMPCYGYALNCHLFYLAIPGIRQICMKKQNVFVLFIGNRKIVKFKSVQINIKHVSYRLGWCTLTRIVIYLMSVYYRHLTCFNR